MPDNPDYTPSLSDLANLSVEEIMGKMGYSPDDIEKYGEYFQDYDRYKEDFAEERRTLDLAKIGLQETGLDLQQQMTTDLYGLGQQAFDTQIGQTITGGEQGVYGLLAQQDTLAAAGLGDRSRFTDRARKGLIENVGTQLGGINLQRQEADVRYGGAMSGFGLEKAGLGMQESLADLDYRRTVAESQRQYEDEFWDFLTTLSTEFDVESDYEESLRREQTFQDVTGIDPNDPTNDQIGDYTGRTIKNKGWREIMDENTWCCTAAMETGHLSNWKTARLKVWHRKQSKIWQDGYHIWGKFIAKHLVSKYDWAGRWTEAFYQSKVCKKHSNEAIGATILIAPMSYLIGTFKQISNIFKKKKLHGV